ncbi:MAG TPA: DUF2294 domain-containing protein [Spirochaetota bacterium]|nr:DUF2294 domain-containing protein [Spirochaetota bacterium]HRS78146.1 DUF2294 domain-containing protein [Spirochaetota bacterium]HRT74249.1 DUF2294 domain-containing protein [Spirochaetota bacterium]
MKDSRSKGMIEAEISDALVRFEKEYMGRGPVETRTYIIEDMVIVRLKGVLTKAEEQLTKSDGGLMLIKQVRVKLLEEARHLLETIVGDITGTAIVSMHTDISTTTGERVIIFTLDRNLEEKILSGRTKKD